MTICLESSNTHKIKIRLLKYSILIMQLANIFVSRRKALILSGNSLIKINFRISILRIMYHLALWVITFYRCPHHSLSKCNEWLTGALTTLDRKDYIEYRKLFSYICFISIHPLIHCVQRKSDRAKIQTRTFWLHCSPACQALGVSISSIVKWKSQ